MRIETGSSLEHSAKDAFGIPNGWFVGSRRFIPDGSLRQIEACEIKWSIHPKGFFSGVKPCAPGWGISVLISGDFVIALREKEDTEWVENCLNRQGDFIISHGGHSHWYRADTDCVLITFRLTNVSDDGSAVERDERHA